uniref:Uncharacterized protein n=1 Tax=Eptatretus burgeri TaxID=7764 RepID=A0A8C4Q463_EPTBU
MAKDEKAMSLDVRDACGARSREEDVREGDKNREIAVHTEGDRPQRLCAFPMSRIKSLMKFDPDLGLANPESVFLIARAAVTPRLYLFKKMSFHYPALAKRKTGLSDRWRTYAWRTSCVVRVYIC